MHKLRYSFTVITILFFLFLGYVAFLPHQDISFDNEDCLSFNDGWTYVDTNGNEQTVSLPAELPTNMENGVRIQNTLPADTSVTVNSFAEYCVFQEIKIYIEDELIYTSTDPNRTERHFDKTDGAFWLFASLPADSAGKEITLELTSPYSDYTGTFGNVFIGTKGTIIFQLLHRYGFNLFISILFALSGIGFLCLSIYLFRKNMPKRNLSYLGWFQFWIGIWIFSESSMAQFFIGNAPLVNILAFVSIRLLIISFFHYYGLIGQFHWEKLRKFLLILLYIEATISTLLQLFQIRDFYETLFPFHLLLFGCILFLAANVIYEAIIHKNKQVYHFVYSMIALCVCSVLELYLFYFGERINVGDVISVGLVFCVVIIAYRELEKAFHMIELGREASYYEKLAKLDFMTGCYNRTAFLHDIEKQNDAVAQGQAIATIMCDVNNLKHINDFYGHQAGDSAILSCSKHLRHVFSDFGNCYRTGGDEFTCIVYPEDEAQLQERIDQFLTICKEENTHCEHEFSVAIGYAYFDSQTDASIENAITRADANMYHMKRQMKSVVVQ